MLNRLDVPDGSRSDTPLLTLSPSRESFLQPFEAASPVPGMEPDLAVFTALLDAGLRPETTVPSMPFFGGGNSLGLQSTQRMPGTLSARLSARGTRRAWARGSAPKAASGRERGRSFPRRRLFAPIGREGAWLPGRRTSLPHLRKLETNPRFMLCSFACLAGVT